MNKGICISFLVYLISFACVAQEISTLPAWNNQNEKLIKEDWLVNDRQTKAGVDKLTDCEKNILYNSLLNREIIISPNLPCIDYKNLVNGQQLIRAIKPEARVVINNTEYNAGGLYGQTENAYLLPEWVNSFSKGKQDFVFSGLAVSDLKPFLNWKCNTWILPHKPASGIMLSLNFIPQDESLNGLELFVHHELYEGIPLTVKCLSVENMGNSTFHLNRVINEILALVEEESAVLGSPERIKKQYGIYVETNYAFNNAMSCDISDQTTHWKLDSSYPSQVNYNYQTPCLLEIYPEKAPGIDFKPGEVFNSVRTHELLMDSYDRKCRGLAIRQMYRTIAPWTNQSPIFMYLVSRNDKQVYKAIDQFASTGYEALNLSFGRHCHMEDSRFKKLEKWKVIADYAHKKGILIGSYSLFSSCKISDSDDVIDPETGKPGGAFFGNAPCFESKWGLNYRDKIKQFYTYTGFDIWENDGLYPGDVCASTTHPSHRDLDDSQWQQMNIQKELYHWLNENGAYINAPDWYFLDVTHKIAIGYREINFSLSGEQQKILNRQNIYDGSWEKTPSMSWGFVQLTNYQGGGPDAVPGPLSEHIKDYEQLRFHYISAGVQACYRRLRLYDTDETKKMISNTIAWYKNYREILNSDIIRLRCGDGRDWDEIAHVIPKLKQEALVLLFNPTSKRIEIDFKLPLYYAGFTEELTVKDKNDNSLKYKLNRDYTNDLKLYLEPGSYEWFAIE